jgi:hypothetical protein
LGVSEESQVADERSDWTEAADWAERLLRHFLMLCERKGVEK